MSKNQRDVSHIDEGEISEPVAIRYDFDGNGYFYMDAGSGSDWASRVKDCEFLYTHPIRELSMSEIDKHFNQSWYQDDNGVHFDHYGFATTIIKASRGEK